MAKNLPYEAWDYRDLQSRYERAQLLANDCTQDFAGNYFFPSDRSPVGYWTVIRKQRLDYFCTCPDFGRTIDQQLINSAPSRWVRNDWSTRPDNRILVNRCLHCLAVAIAEQELDPSYPINRIYQAKRTRYPKTDCGCGCGGSGDCGCPNKVLGLPENRLIQGCETDCYVEPLTPRTQRTVSTTEGIPAYQTFEIQKVEFAQTRYQGCFGDKVTLQLKRSTSQGFNNATVVGLPTNIEFPFAPEFRTSSQEITLDFFAPGIYTIGIGAIAVGNFGDALEAQIEILDCGVNLDNVDCPPQGFVDFSDGKCEGSYLVAFRQTGNKNPDGTCEQIKVLQYQQGLACPFPEPPTKECESTIPRDCTPAPLSPPACVNTSNGDGSNSNSGQNAVVRVLTGGKRTEYLRPDKKECAEYCDFAEISIHSPSCPEPPRKPPAAPTCGYARRYIGWEKYDPSTGGYGGSVSTTGTAIAETFSCDDGTTYGLRAYTARCVAPSNRVLDDFAAANYQGDEFGEGCCPFDETKPPRPACPPSKFSCSGGVCSADPNGSYNSLAECQAALIPPSFTGGQCSGTLYSIYVSNIDPSTGIRSAPFLGTATTGKINSFTSFNPPDSPGGASEASIYVYTESNPSGILVSSVNGFFGRDFQVEYITGSPDNCGNAPSTCP